MIQLLPHGSQFSVFLLASLALAVTPGPGVFYIVTRSLVQGRGHGLVSVAGIGLGNLGNALAASLGLAAIFSVSAVAFAAVKFIGAFYLIYLGVQMLRHADAERAPRVVASVSLIRVFRDAVVVALFNPKTTLFFAAFLPQFLTAEASPIFQSALLGVSFVVIAVITDSIYALAASALAPVLRGYGARRMGHRLGGGVFIGLGMLTAFSGARGAK